MGFTRPCSNGGVVDRGRSCEHLWPGSGQNPGSPAGDGKRVRHRAKQRARCTSRAPAPRARPGRREGYIHCAGLESGRATSRSAVRSTTAPTGAATAPTGRRTEPTGAPGSREHPSGSTVPIDHWTSGSVLPANTTTGIPADTWASPPPDERARASAPGVGAGRRTADPGSGRIAAPDKERAGRCRATPRQKRAAGAGAAGRP